MISLLDMLIGCLYPSQKVNIFGLGIKCEDVLIILSLKFIWLGLMMLAWDIWEYVHFQDLKFDSLDANLDGLI